MAGNVITIPAACGRYRNADSLSESGKKRRVAGYARVSTGMEEQQTSYAAQCSEYTACRQHREAWECGGVSSGGGSRAC